jgi:hypothetical protein
MQVRFREAAGALVVSASLRAILCIARIVQSDLRVQVYLAEVVADIEE